MNQILDPLDVSKENIWNYAQNKPTLIAKDLELFGVPKRITYKILLARGVFKWLNVRRKLISLKNIWKGRITAANHFIVEAKRFNQPLRREYHRGYLAAMEQCRKEVRALCHSERYAWEDRDFDRGSFEFLKDLGKNK